MARIVIILCFSMCDDVVVQKVRLVWSRSDPCERSEPSKLQKKEIAPKKEMIRVGSSFKSHGNELLGWFENLTNGQVSLTLTWGQRSN